MGPLAEAGYRVVAPDLRGYNLTGKRPPYNVLALVRDVERLLDAAGAKSALVAGHDWGAVLAWLLAALQPRRVERLAILNVPHPAAMRRLLARGNLRQALKSWYILFFQVPRLPEWLLSRRDYAPLRRLMRATALPGTFTDLDLDRYRDAWARPGALTAAIGWYRAFARISLRLRPAALDLRVAPPTVLIWGEQDVALTLRSARESMAWVDQGRLIRLPRATHWVHQDCPDVVNEHLLRHFAGARRS